MPIPVDLVIFAINALLRVGSAVNKAILDGAIDSKAVFPDVTVVPWSGRDELSRRVREEHEDLVDPVKGAFRHIWQHPGGGATQGKIKDAAPDSEVSRLAVQVAYLEYQSAVSQGEPTGASESPAQASVLAYPRAVQAQVDAGQIMLAQWSKDADKPRPWLSVAVALADVALEFVAQDPGRVGVHGKIQPLVRAFAANVSLHLGDVSTLGPRDVFAQRLFAVLLRSSLESLGHEGVRLIGDQDVRELVDAAVAPVLKLAETKLTGDVTSQLKFRELVDTVLGPSAVAVFKKIAEEPGDYFGKSFRTAKPLGVFVAGIFNAAATTEGVSDILTERGGKLVLGTALDVVAKHPDYLIKARDGDPPDVIAQKFVGRLASTLKTAMTVGGTLDGLPAAILVAALESTAENAHLFSKPGQEWTNLAIDLGAEVLGIVRDELIKSTAGVRALTLVQAERLARVALEHIADAPQIVTGKRRESLQKVVRAVAAGMAADKHLLLSGDDWVDIFKITASEAAKNVGGLFHLRTGDPDSDAAEKLIKILLTSANAIVGPDGKLTKDPVLYGETLKQAIAVVIETYGRRPPLSDAQRNAIGTVALQVEQFIASNAGQYSTDLWLVVFRYVIRQLPELAGGPPTIDSDLVQKALKAGG